MGMPNVRPIKHEAWEEKMPQHDSDKARESWAKRNAQYLVDGIVGVSEAASVFERDRLKPRAMTPLSGRA
jgi:hypothetical protein